ncbi:hypothetical protein PR048_007720, partial [Dryococelus australis]
MRKRRNTSATKTGDSQQRHRLARFPLAKIQKRPHWELNPVGIGGRRVLLPFPLVPTPREFRGGDSDRTHVSCVGHTSILRESKTDNHGARGPRSVDVVRLLASTSANQFRFPVASLPYFRVRGSCWMMPQAGGFSRGSPISPPLYSGAAPYSPHFTLIGSQDLHVKSCLHLFPFFTNHASAVQRKSHMVKSAWFYTKYFSRGVELCDLPQMTRVRFPDFGLPMISRNRSRQILGCVHDKGHGRFIPFPSSLPLTCATCTVSKDLAVDETLSPTVYLHIETGFQKRSVYREQHINKFKRINFTSGSGMSRPFRDPNAFLHVHFGCILHIHFRYVFSHALCKCKKCPGSAFAKMHQKCMCENALGSRNGPLILLLATRYRCDGTFQDFIPGMLVFSNLINRHAHPPPPPRQGEPSPIPAGSSDFRKWESCRTMPLVGRFPRGSPASPPLHSGAAPYSLQSLPSALKTSPSRAARISSLRFTYRQKRDIVREDKEWLLHTN